MLDVTELASVKGCRIGTLGDLIVTVFHGLGTLEQLKLLEEQQAKFVAAKGKVISLTVIASERLEPPTPEFRDYSTKLHHRFEPHLHCSAVVITTKGFAAVIARSFLAAYQLVVRYQTPHHTFRDISAAVAWVQKTAPHTVGLVGATEALEKFCAPG